MEGRSRAARCRARERPSFPIACICKSLPSPPRPGKPCFQSQASAAPDGAGGGGGGRRKFEKSLALLPPLSSLPSLPPTEYIVGVWTRGGGGGGRGGRSILVPLQKGGGGRRRRSRRRDFKGSISPAHRSQPPPPLLRMPISHPHTSLRKGGDLEKSLAEKGKGKSQKKS